LLNKNYYKKWVDGDKSLKGDVKVSLIFFWKTY